MFSKLKDLIGQTTKVQPAPESYELSYAEFADFLLRRMHEKQPPFDRNEWHLATVEIPSDWDAVFEVICEMNAIAVGIWLIITIHGQATGVAALQAIIDHVEYVSEENGKTLAAFLVAIVFANPIAADDPVFQREDTVKWSQHLLVFGRAKEALALVQIEERHRPEALSRLGRCMVYATDCSTTRFSTLVNKLRLH
jgi:hypothetical protein